MKNNTTNLEFVVRENNMHSMADMVDPDLTSTIAQFLQLQTLCYYYDIAIVCNEKRQQTCDLLTHLNQLAKKGMLPKRTKQLKGRAYLNKDGVMIFSDMHFKPYSYAKRITLTSNSDLSLSQIKYINNMLLKNYRTCRLTPQEKSYAILPKGEDKTTIQNTMMQVVQFYKVTFDLNRPIEELYNSQCRCLRGIAYKSIPAREVDGEAYINDNHVICFKPCRVQKQEILRVTDGKIIPDVIEYEIKTAEEKHAPELDQNFAPSTEECEKPLSVNNETQQDIQDDNDDDFAEMFLEAYSDVIDEENTELPKEENKEQEVKTKEPVKEDVSKKEASSFYIYSFTSDDRKKRYVAYGNNEHYELIECGMRTTVKSYTATVIEKLVESGAKNFTVYIDKRAKVLLVPIDSFSSETDIKVCKLKNEFNINLEILDPNDASYLQMKAGVDHANRITE